MYTAHKNRPTYLLPTTYLLTTYLPTTYLPTYLPSIPMYASYYDWYALGFFGLKPISIIELLPLKFTRKIILKREGKNIKIKIKEEKGIS